MSLYPSEDFVFRNIGPVYFDPFPISEQMGGGKQSRSISILLIDGSQHMGHGTFSIGTCDVNTGPLSLGIAQIIKKTSDPGQIIRSDRFLSHRLKHGKSFHDK